MDSRIIYCAEPDELWAALKRTAQRDGGVVHGVPPEIAVELPEARLYVSETETSGDLPDDARSLGGGVREFVIDVHNAPVAERFLADAIEELDVVVDDDDGYVADGRAFVAAVRSGYRP